MSASEVECQPGARHEFADGGECLGCGRTFADWTHGGIRVDRMTLRENRESLTAEQRRVHQPDQEQEARLWISILAPALRLKTNSPRRFAALFPYWEGRPAAERARSMEAGYVFRPGEPKPMEISDVADALSYGLRTQRPGSSIQYIPPLDGEGAGDAERKKTAVENKLYGVTASSFQQWKDSHSTRFKDGFVFTFDEGSVDYATLEARVLANLEYTFVCSPIRFKLGELRRPGETDAQTRERVMETFGGSYKEIPRVEIGDDVFLDGEGFARRAAASEEPFGRVVAIEDDDIVIVQTGARARGLGHSQWMKLRQRPRLEAIPAVRATKWRCCFKKCLMLVSPDQVDMGHGLCDVHYIERLRVEGGAGIAPQHRYVTKPGEIRTVVTCDLGADWED